MTQKRFNYEGAKVFDGEEFLCCTLSIWVKQLVDLLNELHEEKEQLKKENQMLKHTIGRNESYIARLTHTGEWKDTSKPLYRSISRGD